MKKRGSNRMAQVNGRQKDRKRVFTQTNAVRQDAESNEQSGVSAERRRVRTTSATSGRLTFKVSTERGCGIVVQSQFVTRSDQIVDDHGGWRADCRRRQTWQCGFQQDEKNR